MATKTSSPKVSASSFDSGKEKTWQEKVERFILLTQGKNMVEELSFVHLFHYQKGNLIVHMIGQPLVLFAAIVSPIAWLMPIQCVFFIALSYTLVYSLWDVKVAVSLLSSPSTCSSCSCTCSLHLPLPSPSCFLFLTSFFPLLPFFSPSPSPSLL
jgi:hypothetical protein